MDRASVIQYGVITYARNSNTSTLVYASLWPMKQDRHSDSCALSYFRDRCSIRISMHRWMLDETMLVMYTPLGPIDRKDNDISITGKQKFVNKAIGSEILANMVLITGWIIRDYSVRCIGMLSTCTAWSGVSSEW